MEEVAAEEVASPEISIDTPDKPPLDDTRLAGADVAAEKKPKKTAAKRKTATKKKSARQATKKQKSSAKSPEAAPIPTEASGKKTPVPEQNDLQLDFKNTPPPAEPQPQQQPGQPPAENVENAGQQQPQQRPPQKQGNHPGQHQKKNRGGNHGQGQKGQKQKRFDNKKKKKKKDKKKGQDPPLGPPMDGEGFLEISGKGFGFLRQRSINFKQAPDDIFITPETVRTYGLRDGVWIEGEIREGNRGPQLTELRKVNGEDPEKYKHLPIFDELTAINPAKRIILETAQSRYTTRIIDMVAPIGRGQRGLIVAPPRTGKTTLLQHIAEAVIENHSSMKLIILLVDERPEEVTELSRALPGAEIMASSNDSDVKSHTRIAQLAIERAKRYVEAGEHVFMLLDSITRLGRAFNNAIKGGGRTGSGGLDIRALEIPRKLFAAARNTREAGSLTIVATALIETGSRADEVIFQEFKGTGNMELVLDRRISEQYVYPAVDIFKSGTRREELLLPPHQLEKIYVIRRGLSGHKPVEAIQRLLSFCERFPSNAQMLLEIPG